MAAGACSVLEGSVDIAGNKKFWSNVSELKHSEVTGRAAHNTKQITT